jgi:hypothetical protein
MTNSTPLSTAAQAVLDAASDVYWDWTDMEPAASNVIAAAALRAAADQVVPLTKTPWGTTLIPVLTAQESRDRLLAIAAELEGVTPQ